MKLTEQDFERAAKKLKSNMRPRQSAFDVLNMANRNTISVSDRFLSFAKRKSASYVQYVRFFQLIYKRIFTPSACFRTFVIMMAKPRREQPKFLGVGGILSRRDIFQIANMIITWVGINVINTMSLWAFAKKYFGNQTVNKIVLASLSLMTEAYTQITFCIRFCSQYFGMRTPFECSFSAANLSIE